MKYLLIYSHVFYSQWKKYDQSKVLCPCIYLITTVYDITSYLATVYYLTTEVSLLIVSDFFLEYLLAKVWTSQYPIWLLQTCYISSKTPHLHEESMKDKWENNSILVNKNLFFSLKLYEILFEASVIQFFPFIELLAKAKTST